MSHGDRQCFKAIKSRGLVSLSEFFEYGIECLFMQDFCESSAEWRKYLSHHYMCSILPSKTQ